LLKQVVEGFAKGSEVSMNIRQEEVSLDYTHYTLAACVADQHGVSKVM
jgi:hypothetical protein